MESRDVPEVGEIVIVKVTKVLNYGVFVDLLEYENVNGFVHISQVASSWIKNIRNFVKENQMRAAKVTKIDFDKGQIDLSLVKVPSNVQRQKIEEWKHSKRMQKLLELMAEAEGTTFDNVWKEVAEPLLENHDSLYSAFEQIAIEGIDIAKGVKKAWLKPLQELVEKNIEIPQKTVRGIVELHSSESNGVEIIKKALAKGEKEFKEGIEIIYKGSSKFLIKSTSYDYKTSEKNLRKVGAVISSSTKNKGTVEFEVLGKKIK